MSRARAEGGFDQLTDRERRVLRLLASGHSVKSAAAAEAITENAANELLRAARRKLGTGSSREAARLFAGHERGTQKIRDEKSGIPRGPAGAQSSARFNKGMFAMIAIAVAAGAGAMFAMQGDPASPNAAGTARATGPAPASPAGAGAPSGQQPVAQAPRVVATVPAAGAVISPGPFRLVVTFDRAMAPKSYAFVRSDEGAYPDCTGEPELSADGRSYSQACAARAPGRYVIHFNRSPYLGFVDAETRVPAEEARLEFTVGGEAQAAPKVVSTSPADGAVIDRGPFTVSVTYDRPMLPGAMSVVRTDEGAFPDCSSRPQLSADGRTWTIECVAPVAGMYVMYFNRPPYMNFRDAGTQVSADPKRLQFMVRD